MANPMYNASTQLMERYYKWNLANNNIFTMELMASRTEKFEIMRQSGCKLRYMFAGQTSTVNVVALNILLKMFPFRSARAA